MLNIHSKKNILIIENDVLILRFLRDVLQDKYNIIPAENGEKGIALLKSRHIDLVVLDIFLPDINGLQLLSGIRNESDIPVLIISGYGSKEIVLDSWRLGANYYFDKPLDILELKKIINYFLKNELYNSFYDLIDIDRSRLSFPIKASIDYIMQNLHRKITLAEASGIASLNSSYFSALFKKECGISFHSFVTISKIEKSKKLLKEPSKSIKEIAFETGFTDPFNFSKLFKKMTGVSPREYKRHVTN